MPEYNKSFKKSSDKNLIRWLLVIVFVWFIPSMLFWSSLFLFLSEVCERKDLNSLDEIENQLENIAYDSSRERYFQKKFSKLFSSLKGQKFNSKSLLNQVLKDNTRNFPPDMVEVYLFDGDLKILETKGAQKAYEKFLDFALKDFEGESITEEQTKEIGKIIPEPTLILKRIRGQKGRAIELGNPDNYSLCFFDFDEEKNNDILNLDRKDKICGILIFVHYIKLKNEIILSETIPQNLKKNFGFIDLALTKDSNNENKDLVVNFLPETLNNTPLSEDYIKTYYKQNPTNRFRRYSKLLCLKRLSEQCLLVGAKDINQPQWLIYLITALAFIVVSFFFLKITYTAFVLNPNQSLNLRHRIIWLFVLCYVMPLIVGAILSSQYLMELKSSLLISEEQKNYKRLSEIDSGFARFTTSKLIEYRNITEEMSKNVEKPELIVDKLKSLCEGYIVDSAHLVSSDSKILLTSVLTASEVRRHKDKTREEQEEIWKTWADRHAILSSVHSKSLFEGDKVNIYPPPNERAEAHKAFTRVFANTCSNAMDYYNQSKNINSVTKKSKQDILVGAIVEANSLGLFQYAKTNISRFTPLEAIQEKVLAFLDILPGPNGEAWYGYVTITNIDCLERLYLTDIFHDIKVRNSRINRIYPEEDIRAISVHPFATCFPGLMEYHTFEQTIRQSENNSKTFTHKMTLNGEACCISVLRCSYLKHYLLLKVFKEKDIDNIYKKQVNTIIMLFVIVMVMGLALARLMTKIMVMPITDIINGVKAFAQKNYDFNIKIRSENEFGTLSKAFNDTASSLIKLDISGKTELFFPLEKEFRCGSCFVQTAKKTTSLVASEYFDCIQLKQGTFAIVSANISGKDVESIHLMTMLKAACLTLIPMFPNNPDQIMNKLDKLFEPYLKTNHIISCFIGILDPTNESILCTNAGQPYPILYDIKRQTPEFINLPSTYLGIGANSGFSYGKHEISLRHKIIVIYSHESADIINKNVEDADKNSFIRIVGDTFKGDNANQAEAIVKNITNNSNMQPWSDDILIVTIQNRI